MRAASRTIGAMGMALVVLLTFVGCADSQGDSDEVDQGAPSASAPEVSPSTAVDEVPEAASEDVVSATSFRFNTDEITVEAGETTKLKFVNNDPAPHNISVYLSKGGKSLFEGKSMGDGESTTYRIPPMKKGRYYFVCDIHPVMEGEVIAR